MQVFAHFFYTKGCGNAPFNIKLDKLKLYGFIYSIIYKVSAAQGIYITLIHHLSQGKQEREKEIFI